MKNIGTKIPNTASTESKITAEEFNSIVSELKTLVSNYQNFDIDDNSQILKSIDIMSKSMIYTDIGFVNNVELVRNTRHVKEEILVDNLLFMFSPKESNTGATTIKLNEKNPLPLLNNGLDLEEDYLKVGVTYFVTYDSTSNSYNIVNIAGISDSAPVEQTGVSSSDGVLVTDESLGEVLSNKDLVFIDQTDNKYYKAIKDGTDTQTQNVIGMLIINDDSTKQIVFSGVIDDYDAGLIPGLQYYLSNTVAGKISDDVTLKDIIVGRSLPGNKFLLDISGNVSITYSDVVIIVYDTSIVHNETSDGNTLTDPSETMTLNFDKVTVDLSIPSVVTYIDVDGVTAKIDYASEYDTNDFSVTVGDVTYVGTFSENEDYNNPTVLTQG